jgi:hypothetical protein
MVKTGKSVAKSTPAVAKDERASKRPQSTEDRTKGINKRVGWINHKLGLENPIYIPKSGLEKIDYGSAMQILKVVEEKKDTIRDPTRYIQAATNKIPDLKVRKRLAWLNEHANLQENINYEEVKEPLARIHTRAAMKLFSDLEEKAAQIKNPTSWLIASAGREEPWIPNSGGSRAVQAVWVPASSAGQAVFVPSGLRGGRANNSAETVDKSVRKVIGWYNNHGGLQEPLNFPDLAPLLSAIGTKASLQILKKLEDNAATIRSPTAWVCNAAKKLL